MVFQSFINLDLVQKTVSAIGPGISVIIPALNEAIKLPGTLARVAAALPGAEVIVVDGGSADGTPELARAGGAKVIVSATAGRGAQLAEGADAASRSLLLFLHADTLLPADAASVLARAFADRATQIGTFRLSFDGGNWFLHTCAWFSRFDSVFTRFGDQVIVVRHEFYARIGGFPRWPLFEDVELLRSARQLTRIVSFPAQVTTSSRRFQFAGHFKQQIRNGWLLLRFLAGVSPHKLAREYRRPSPFPPTSQ